LIHHYNDEIFSAGSGATFNKQLDASGHRYKRRFKSEFFNGLMSYLGSQE